MPSDLHRLSIWLREQGVDEAVIAYASHCTSLGRCETFSNRSRLVQHRSPEVRQDLVILRARNTLVAVRTELINTTRGLVKSAGYPSAPV